VVVQEAAAEAIPRGVGGADVPWATIDLERLSSVAGGVHGTGAVEPVAGGCLCL
jgi:hypothetical protein